MSELYSIILSDNTVIADLELNGNNFISKNEIDPNIFTDNCSPVTFVHKDKHVVHENMELVHVTKYGSETWFSLRDLSKIELESAKNRSDIEYLAIMCNVEL